MASTPLSPRVCPWWLCFTFDNPLRRLVHDPHRILSPYVREGDTVVDMGPGMGSFTIPLARTVGDRGRVTAVDLQPQRLERLGRRADVSACSSQAGDGTDLRCGAGPVASTFSSSAARPA